MLREESSPTSLLEYILSVCDERKKIEIQETWRPEKQKTVVYQEQITSTLFIPEGYPKGTQCLLRDWNL